MYKPQHACTNYKQLLRFALVAQKRDGRIATFGLAGSSATFRYLPEEPMGFEMYEVKYGRYTIRFGICFEEQMIIPFHVEDWCDGFDMDVFVTGTAIRKPMVMTKGDQILYEIGKRINIFSLDD